MQTWRGVMTAARWVECVEGEVATVAEEGEATVAEEGEVTVQAEGKAAMGEAVERADHTVPRLTSNHNVCIRHYRTPCSPLRSSHRNSLRTIRGSSHRSKYSRMSCRCESRWGSSQLRCSETTACGLVIAVHLVPRLEWRRPARLKDFACWPPLRR